jgi:hypothetical protein
VSSLSSWINAGIAATARALPNLQAASTRSLALRK